jgi:hypothetical protein
MALRKDWSRVSLSSKNSGSSSSAESKEMGSSFVLPVKKSKRWNGGIYVVL